MVSVTALYERPHPVWYLFCLGFFLLWVFFFFLPPLPFADNLCVDVRGPPPPPIFLLAKTSGGKGGNGVGGWRRAGFGYGCRPLEASQTASLALTKGKAGLCLLHRTPPPPPPPPDKTERETHGMETLGPSLSR